MKVSRVYLLIGILTIAASLSFAQTAATSPPAQSASSPATTAGPDKKLMTDEERKGAESEMAVKINEYEWKGNWYLALYYVLSILAALLGSLAALVLQWDTPEKSYKKIATILAFSGAALITVMTFVDFSANSRANKTASSEVSRLRLQVRRGVINDPNDFAEKMLEIRDQRRQLALPKSQ